MRARLHNNFATSSQYLTTIAWFAASVYGVGFCASSEAQAQSVSKERQGRLEEVIVTAQKRQDRLQEVPISLSVLSGEDMDSATVEGVTEALSRVPGVATIQFFQGGGTNVAVRGVSAAGATFSGSSPISYYLDWVPFGLVKSAIGPDSNAYDLDRVEVLRGPQGTLYGASAQNGVVRVLTKDANPDKFEFKARTSVSATQEGGENYRGDLALNVPIVEGKFAARAVAGYQDSSGWIDKPNDKDANDVEIRNLRLKLQAQPTEQLSIGLSTWLSRADYGALSTSDINGQQSSLFDEPMSTDYDVYGLRIGYDSAWFSVASMTGYMDYANGGYLDAAPVGVNLVFSTRFDAEVFSQELVVNSAPDSPWRWTLGAFYRDGEDRLRQDIVGGAPFVDSSNGSESYAAFGEVGRRFFHDALEWTLGVRYFHDDVFVQDNAFNDRYGDSFNATTPRAVLTWYPNSDLTVYASYAEGFRSGFPQDPWLLRQFPTFPALKPDKLHNYEIGAKGDVLDERISFETALYFIDWRDVQQQLTVPIDGNFVAAPVNGQSASGIGIDFAVTVRPLEGLELGANVSWNDLTMDSQVLSGGGVLFEKGDRLGLSPERTVGVTADYFFPMGRNGFRGQFSASANYTSEQDWRGIDVVATSDPMTIARTSFSIHAPDRWVATFYADNVTNETDSALRPVFPPGVVNPYWDARVRPRTLGMQLEYQF